MSMSTRERAESVEELESRIRELEERIESVEGIFSERLLAHENAHVQAKQQDARDEIQVGETRRLVVDSPPGEGQDPNKAVGRINGIVTFVDPKKRRIGENDVLKVQVKDVQQNSAKANVLTKVNE
jgi:TolA-binding protein